MRLIRPLDSQINLAGSTAGNQILKTIGSGALGFAIDSTWLGSCAHKDSDWLDTPCNATAVGLIIVPRCKDLKRLNPAASYPRETERTVALASHGGSFYQIEGLLMGRMIQKNHCILNFYWERKTQEIIPH